MTRVQLAIIVGEDGRRYKLTGWRNGSHETSPPTRPAKLSMLTDEEGWQFLESWNGANLSGEALGNKPKSDLAVLDRALTVLRTSYGVDVAEIILTTSNQRNHLNEPLGWGYESSTSPNLDIPVTVLPDDP